MLRSLFVRNYTLIMSGATFSTASINETRLIKTINPHTPKYNLREQNKESSCDCSFENPQDLYVLENAAKCRHLKIANNKAKLHTYRPNSITFYCPN